MRNTVVYLTVTDREHTICASAMVDFNDEKKYYVSTMEMRDLQVSEDTYQDYLDEIHTGEYIATAEVYDRGGNLVKCIDYTNVTA